MEWFDQYVFFLAKALTVLLVVGALIVLIAASKGRGKRAEGTLQVSRLNDRFQRMNEQLSELVHKLFY